MSWMRAISIAFGALIPLATSGATAGTLTTLYTFPADGSNGAGLGAQLIFDQAGNIYGTASIGGGSATCNAGCGTVFRISPNGKEKTLHAFAGGADGAFPASRLLLDSAGNIYGTTSIGGTGPCSVDGDNGCGTVFKIAPDGTETILYSFQGFSAHDGEGPNAGLIADASGNLYGTTTGGGRHSYTTCRTADAVRNGCGTVFKIAPDGTETILHSFCVQTSCMDGALPFADLLADSQGNLYGTTQIGGTSPNCSTETVYIGCGTVFELAPDGTATVLHSFTGPDGEFPTASVAADGQGNLYGTAGAGGGWGTIFKLSPDGTLTNLYTFTGGLDGKEPTGVAFGLGNSNGQPAIYGSAVFGALDCDGTGTGCGTIYQLPANGSFMTLYRFHGAGDGKWPGQVSFGPSGALFGTTTANGAGAVFKWTPD